MLLMDAVKYKKIKRNCGKLITTFLFIAVLIAVYSHLVLWSHPYMIDDEGLSVMFWLRNGANGTIPMRLDIGFAAVLYGKILSLFFSPRMYKLAQVFCGIISCGCVYYILRRFVSRRISLLGVLMILMQSVFLTQGHRLRPEIVHVTWSMLSVSFMLFSLKSAKKYNTQSFINVLRDFFKDWRLLLGVMFMIFVPNTHIIGITAVPGMIVFLTYVLHNKTHGIRRCTLGLLCIIGFVALLSFAITQPRSLDITYVLRWKRAIAADVPHWQAPERLIDRIKGTFSTYFTYARENVASLYHSKSGRRFMRALSWSNNRELEFKFLNIGFFIVSFLSSIRCLIKRKLVSKESILVLASLSVVVTYIVHVFVLYRMTSYYLIIPVPWLVMGLLAGFSSIRNDLLFSTSSPSLRAMCTTAQLGFGSLVFVILFLGYWNMYKYIWQARDSNYVRMSQAIDKELTLRQCEDLPVVSEQYWPLYRKFSPLTMMELAGWSNDSKMSKQTYQNLMKKTINRLSRNPNSCLVLSAWHYYGLYHFAQFKSLDELKKIYEKYFEISTIEMPFYKNDKLYPLDCKDEPDCKGLNYPIGVPGLWYGGKETVFILKPKKEYIGDIEREICSGNLYAR